MKQKYSLLAKQICKIADKHKVSLEDLLFSSKDEIILVVEMDNSDQKVMNFDDYVCELNQNNIINYFIQGRQKNYCVIHLTQSYKTSKDVR